MYYDIVDSVPISSVKDYHIRINKRNYIYVYTEQKWDQELKKYNRKEILIGKISNEDRTLMYPNLNYFKLLNKKDIIELNNNKEDISEENIAEPGNVGYIINFGNYIALYKAAENIRCIDPIKEAFPTLFKKIIALAIFSIDNQRMVSQDFEYWYFDNYCNLKKKLFPSEISNIYSEIGKDEEKIDLFKKRFRENYYEVFPEAKYHVLAFDSTNQNTSSEDLEFAEYGHAKVDEHLPIVNTAMFVDQTTGIPLFYEHYFGSIVDMSQTPYTIEKVRDLGFKKIFLMMDRGYFSQEVFESLKGYLFAVSCPDRLDIVKFMLDKYAKEIKDQEKYFIEEESVYGIVEENCLYCNNRYNIYLYYDNDRAINEIKSIHEKVDAMIKETKKQKNFSKKMADKFNPWIIVENKIDPKTNKDFTIKRNTDKIQECIDKAGYFVILSNSKKTVTEIIQIARRRDHGEKAFRRIKSQFDLARTYTHLHETYIGKMFIAFIALIIVESYRWFIKDFFSLHSSATTATSLAELRKYKIRHKSDNSWFPVYALTKKQKEIFSGLNLCPKEVIALAKSVKI